MGKEFVGDEVNDQGITRRDLLRRGAALGGAVVWTTPVVQTLGMGRAFAQSTSPEGGKDISYIVIQWDCGDGLKHTKWESGSWQAGALPDCADQVGASSTASSSPVGITIDSVSGPCASITVSDAYANCTVSAFLKAGSSQSTTDPCQMRSLAVGTQTVCTV